MLKGLTNKTGSGDQGRRRSQGCAIVSIALALCLASTAQAKELFDQSLIIEPTNEQQQFIPDNLQFYNPLRQSQGHRRHDPGITGMDNVSLYQAADNYLKKELNASQRALNHQWLEQHHYEMRISQGGRVLSKMIKMGFKTYWGGMRNSKFRTNNYVPDGEGIGKFSEDINYNVRMSDDKVNFTVAYEF